MKVTKTICDRCGLEIPAGQTSAKIEIMSGQRERRPLRWDELDEKDFCQVCTGKIIEFASQQPESQNKKPKETSKETPKETPVLPIAETAEQAASQDAAKPIGRGARIDIGKILALQKAGWKTKDIAWDMNMTERAVQCALYRHKKKQQEKEEKGGRKDAT